MEWVGDLLTTEWDGVQVGTAIMAGVITGDLIHTIAIGDILTMAVDIMVIPTMEETIMETDVKHQEEVILQPMHQDPTVVE